MRSPCGGGVCTYLGDTQAVSHHTSHQADMEGHTSRLHPALPKQRELEVSRGLAITNKGPVLQSKTEEL